MTKKSDLQECRGRGTSVPMELFKVQAASLRRRIASRERERGLSHCWNYERQHLADPLEIALRDSAFEMPIVMEGKSNARLCAVLPYSVVEKSCQRKTNALMLDKTLPLLLVIQVRQRPERRPLRRLGRALLAHGPRGALDPRHPGRLRNVEPRRLGGLVRIELHARHRVSRYVLMFLPLISPRTRRRHVPTRGWQSRARRRRQTS